MVKITIKIALFITLAIIVIALLASSIIEDSNKNKVTQKNNTISDVKILQNNNSKNINKSNITKNSSVTINKSNDTLTITKSVNFSSRLESQTTIIQNWCEPNTEKIINFKSYIIKGITTKNGIVVCEAISSIQNGQISQYWNENRTYNEEYVSAYSNGSSSTITASSNVSIIK